MHNGIKRTAVVQFLRRCADLAGLLSLLMACSGCAPVGQDAPASPGLPWVRFQDVDFTRPSEHDLDWRLELNTGIRLQYGSQIWVGLIEIPTNQPITFSAEAKDGLRLYLDDTLVIDGWEADGDRSGEFQRRKGTRVPLGLDYFLNGGRGHLRLYWQWKRHERELVPASAFFHTPQQAEYIQALYENKMGPGAVEDRSVVYQANEGIPGRAQEAESPLPAQPGPHLLLDDYLIAESSNVARVVLQPQRDPTIPNPIVTGEEDRCVQPFLTVLRDPETGRFRLWYGAWRNDRHERRSHLATMQSTDGVHFIRPHQQCATPEIQFGSEVIDRGPDHPDPTARYVYSYWNEGGLRLLASPDGLAWRSLVEGVVLPHDRDINGIDWDPLRERYVSTVSTDTTGIQWSGKRRTTMMSVSPDLIHWDKLWYVLTAKDDLDEGWTEFYGMDGYLTRGPLRIAMVKVLRDDLRAAGAEADSFGRAHTSLAWSRDGRTWIRDPEMFFEPDPDQDSWDHAHAWIDEQLIVDDVVYMYYSGYKEGHKANRFGGRQIGLVKTPLDRYVARRAAGPAQGTLRTIPIELGDDVQSLTVNADAHAGELRVQLQDGKTGELIPGMTFEDCGLIATDSVQHQVRWKGASLSSLRGQIIQVEFLMRDVDLFAIEFKGVKR